MEFLDLKDFESGGCYSEIGIAITYGEAKITIEPNDTGRFPEQKVILNVLCEYQEVDYFCKDYAEALKGLQELIK